MWSWAGMCVGADTVHRRRWWKAKEIMESNKQDHSLKRWPSLNFILTGGCNTKAFNIASKPNWGCVKEAECREGAMEEAVSVASSVQRPGFAIEEEPDWWPLETSCWTKSLFKFSIYMHSNIPAAILHKCQHQCCLIGLFPLLPKLVCFEKLSIQRNLFRFKITMNYKTCFM